jgi:hypothetical protein
VAVRGAQAIDNHQRDVRAVQEEAPVSHPLVAKERVVTLDCVPAVARPLSVDGGAVVVAAKREAAPVHGERAFSLGAVAEGESAARSSSRVVAAAAHDHAPTGLEEIEGELVRVLVSGTVIARRYGQVGARLLYEREARSSGRSEAVVRAGVPHGVLGGALREGGIAERHEGLVRHHEPRRDLLHPIEEGGHSRGRLSRQTEVAGQPGHGEGLVARRVLEVDAGAPVDEDGEGALESALPDAIPVAGSVKEREVAAGRHQPEVSDQIVIGTLRGTPLA